MNRRVTIHLISHTHWDREWYLTFQQFRLKLVHLIDHLLEILDQDPDYRYFLLDGQAIIVEDYLQMRPERERDLVRHITDGRILIGPWYVSPDEFLIAPESHIRNILEGDRLCRKYGGKMLVGYLPDNFGHIGQMPQLLQASSIDYACLWRGLEDEPSEINWRAPDGSTVLTSYLRTSYSNAANLTTSNPDRFITDVNDAAGLLTPYSRTGQILLMHGTDHMEPSADLTSAIRAFQSDVEQPELIHSNLPQYFDAIRSGLKISGEQLPIILGELRASKHSPILANVLSTRIDLKQRNHTCETELIKWVEPLSAWVNHLTLDQPKSDRNNSAQTILMDRSPVIRNAWKLLMQCHPHDSICGTSIDQVAREMLVRFDQVDQISLELKNQCTQFIANQIDTRYVHSGNTLADQERVISSIVVFNPNDKPQSGLIDIKIKLDKRISSIEMIDEHARPLQFDKIGMGSQELISMTMDKKSLKQAMGMIHEGIVAGLVIRDLIIDKGDDQADIVLTLSDHGDVDLNVWRHAVSMVNEMLGDSEINEYLVHAYSDPEMKLSFIASDVPGHGYRCYWIRGLAGHGQIQAKPIKLNPILKGAMPLITRVTCLPLVSKNLNRRINQAHPHLNSIENDFIKAEVDTLTNSITVTNKCTGQIYERQSRLIDGGDCGDLYNYCPPEHDFLVTAMIKKVEYEIYQAYQKMIVYSELNIPASITADRKSRSPYKIKNTIMSTFTIASGIPRIDIHTQINNQSTDHRIRVHFPAPFFSLYSYHDRHFEVVQRQLELVDFDQTWEESPRPEVPQRQFTCVANEAVNLTIANRGLPEVEVYKNVQGNSEIAITLLRAIGWLSRDDLKTRKGHAGPMGVATPGAQMIGIFGFDYSIIPGDQNWMNSMRFADAFNTPLISIPTQVHGGNLPPMSSMVENNNENFIITSIKAPENGRGLIVRGYNLLQDPIKLSLQTWKIFNLAQLVNLLEEPIETIPLDDHGAITISVGGHKIITILFSD